MNITSEMKNKINENKCIIFTDLDGTLLNHDSYDLGLVPMCLKLLETRGCPVIFNTSKTWAEVKLLQEQLSYFNPCIVENGGGMKVPARSKYSLSKELTEGFHSDQSLPDDHVRLNINQVLDEIGQGFHFERMGQWTDEIVAQNTGLSLKNAHLANQRFYSEPLLWQDSEEQLSVFRQLVDQHQLRLVRGGRFCHVMKQHDKSTYMKKIIEDYENKNGFKPVTIALGDNENDKKMLELADIACVLRLPGKNTMKLEHNCVLYPEHFAPEGWTDTISQIFNFEI